MNRGGPTVVHTPHEGAEDAARSTIPPSLKLTEAESRQYAELGCVVKELTEFVRTLQSVLDPEFVKELQAETDRLLADAAGLTPSTASARFSGTAFGYDFEPDHSPTAKIRMGNFKLNVKASHGGAAIQWHQDWAYYPHTNDSLLAIGIFIDDMTPDNGPLQVFPGTHRGRVFSHHHPTRGFFCGGFRIEDTELAGKVPLKLTGPAGRVVFLEVAAADAWPLTNALLHTVDIASLQGTLYQIQEQMETVSFSGKAVEKKAPLRKSHL